MGAQGSKGEKLMLTKEDLKELEMKVLLLGASESGKTTIFKQMKILHGDGFSAAERQNFVGLIQAQCINNFRNLVSGARMLNLLSAEVEQTALDVLRALDDEGLTHKNVNTLVGLWRSEPLQKAYDQRSRFQLSDSAQFFLDDLERVSEHNFQPCDEDIVMCSQHSKECNELVVSVSGMPFRMVDIGGQRSERRKWISSFDSVETVVFVVAINEFDQVLFEDATTNRLRESLRLFEEISNTRLLQAASMILVLNKKDLFDAKIRTKNLNVCFPEYTGGLSSANAINFITSKFRSMYHNTPSQGFFVHVTTATEHASVSQLLSSVKEAIFLHNVQQSGFL